MESTFKHSFKVATPEKLTLVVHNVGFQKCTPNHSWGPGVRDHFLIHYVVSGRGELERQGQRYPLGAGSAFLISPDDPVYYGAHQEEPWEYYWVGFSGSAAKLFLEQTGFAHSSHLQLENGDPFRRALLDIYKARGSDYSSGVKMAGYLQVVLGLLMESETARGGTSLAAYARQGGEWIQQNYSHPITVEEVAAQVGVSRSYLFRAFQEVFQLSPREYLSQLRIQRACQLLRHSPLSVRAVATSVGFEDHYYFSRAFRQAMGVTPTAYRSGK